MINRHRLMENNITKNDIDVLIKFLKKRTILTQSNNVFNFEKKWSRWLGVKYSVFVNSGSSANLLSINSLKYFLNKNDKRNEIIVPSLTWSSDINAVIQNNYKPVFADISLKTLSLSVEEIKKKINKKTLAVFITHAQGFNPLNDELLKLLKKKKIFLIEDVCESHGAKFRNKKLGSYGLISNFSFYYAHHMSTIEGGMICTNSKKLYDIFCALRSHGLAREIKDKKVKKKVVKKFSHLSDQFIFLYSGYNLRNTEIGGVLGINQLKRLDNNIKKRNQNLKYFLNLLNSKTYYTDFELKGCSNYAFPLILKEKKLKKRNQLEKILYKHKIEFRRGNAGGGNQLRQPYLKDYTKKINLRNFKNVEHVHNFGYYLGNYPDLKKEKILQICKILNNI
jgi:CDP-6-deoxy-D-xylo-4-hexulose-3-dehydrase